MAYNYSSIAKRMADYLETNYKWGILNNTNISCRNCNNIIYNITDEDNYCPTCGKRIHEDDKNQLKDLVIALELYLDEYINNKTYLAVLILKQLHEANWDVYSEYNVFKCKKCNYVIEEEKFCRKCGWKVPENFKKSTDNLIEVVEAIHYALNKFN